MGGSGTRMLVGGRESAPLPDVQGEIDELKFIGLRGETEVQGFGDMAESAPLVSECPGMTVLSECTSHLAFVARFVGDDDQVARPVPLRDVVEGFQDEGHAHFVGRPRVLVAFSLSLDVEAPEDETDIEIIHGGQRLEVDEDGLSVPPAKRRPVMTALHHRVPVELDIEWQIELLDDESTHILEPFGCRFPCPLICESGPDHVEAVPLGLIEVGDVHGADRMHCS